MTISKNWGTAAANCECPLSYGLQSYSSLNLLQKPAPTKRQFGVAFIVSPTLKDGGCHVC